MDSHVYQYLANKPDLLRFVRYEPIWYRYLSRDPTSLTTLEKEAKKFYGKTMPQQLEKVNNHVQMLHMFIQLAGAMKD